MPTVTLIILIVFHPRAPVCPPLSRCCQIAIDRLQIGHALILIRPRAVVIVILNSLHLDFVGVSI
jgi:hypothetical protein